MIQTYIRNPEVEEAPLGTDLMLFDPESAKFFVLNPTMAHVWQQCEQARSADDLIASVADAFAGTEAHPVTEQVKAALDELCILRIILPS